MYRLNFARFVGRQAALSILALGLTFAGSAFAQEKPTISVPEFKNETTWWWWSGGTADELADALSNELTATGNFAVVERQKLGAVLSEQELAELGLVKPETAAATGELTGAQYIILGRVTAYEEDVASESTGGSIGGISIGGVSLGGGGRKEEQTAYVAIDLRVVDSTTGEVVHARTVEGEATSKADGGAGGVNVSGVRVGGDRTKTQRVPVGKAIRAALIEATDYLNCVMVEQGACVAEYEAKDTRRRENTRSVLELD
ncbi:MAG: CsgG/HfaB family protein [Cyanobacteria bacterium P01_H01_bin.15]